MKKIKKNLLRAFCLLTATVSVCSFSGCAEVWMEILQDFVGATQVEYGEGDWNPDTDGSSGGGSVGGGDSSESGKDNPVDPTPTPKPNQPDPSKDLLSLETDEMGHQIAFYTDGTSEDLGRSVALDFAVERPETKYGYQQFSYLEKGAELCSLYQEIYRVSANFHNSGKNAVAVDGNYELAEFTFKDYGLTEEECTSVWRTVGIEYPEFFWWCNSLLVGKRSMTVLVDPLYASGTVRAQTQEQIQNLVADCDTYLDGTTNRHERALTIHDYIIREMDYAYEMDGITPVTETWAHNIAGIATHNAGVCEAYAKTFDYLCGMFNLESLTVVGKALQNYQYIGHAWNMICLDGSWYLLDATWNDCASQGVSRQWWGMANSEFSQTHITNTSDTWGVDYQCEMPEAQDRYLSPTRLYKDGEKQTQLYWTIEDALCMTSWGDNRVILYPDTSVTQDGLPIVGVGATFNDSWITTNGNTTLVGEYEEIDGLYYTLSELDSPSGVMFASNITFENLRFTGRYLEVYYSTLTTTGNAVELFPEDRVYAYNGGTIHTETSGWTSFGKAELYVLVNYGTECRLQQGGSVESVEVYNGGVLRLHGTENVSIGKVYLETENDSLYIDGAMDYTTIDIFSLSTSFGEATIRIVYETMETYPYLRISDFYGNRLSFILKSTLDFLPIDFVKAIANIGHLDYGMVGITYVYSNGMREIDFTNYFYKNAYGEIVR